MRMTTAPSQIFPPAPPRARVGDSLRARIAFAWPQIAGVSIAALLIGAVNSVVEMDGRLFLISAGLAVLSAGMIVACITVLHLLFGRKEKPVHPVTEALTRQILRELDESPLNPARRNLPG